MHRSPGSLIAAAIPFYLLRAMPLWRATRSVLFRGPPLHTGFNKRTERALGDSPLARSELHAGDGPLSKHLAKRHGVNLQPLSSFFNSEEFVFHALI